MTRKEAKISGASRYAGSVCAKHPDGGGVRMTRNGECVECQKDRNKKYYSTTAGKSAKASYMRSYSQCPQRVLYMKAKHGLRGRIRHQHVNLLAKPVWADEVAIKGVYAKCPPGFHVDHIIPLKGKLVCGLHVHYNLHPIPARDNLAKGAK